MPIIHNKALSGFIKDIYEPEDIQDIFELLQRNGTFTFPVLSNGLFPAANLEDSSLYTGYSNVWVRDNIYVAYAHYLNGQTETALRNINTLGRYFLKHKWRFEKIIAGELDYNEPMNRPHIRFNGEDLSEIPQKWAHAENDALGYFLWLFCKIHDESGNAITDEVRELLGLFVRYFEAIRYWEDEDSGHWEERRKIKASSIGVVAGGLTELKKLLEKETSSKFNNAVHISKDQLDKLINKGADSLRKILPAECTQPDPNKNSRFDAALLFLIYPLNIVTEEMADRILYDVTHYLQGDYGIRRYLGDSFWAADYKDKLVPEERTIDFSDNMVARDELLKKGEEAQWCLFDPIISVIYGLKYKKYHEGRFLELQSYYFNRSLGQLTGEDSEFGPFKCPELYYMEKGRYVPNDTVPLLWTQANLWMAFRFML